MPLPRYHSSVQRKGSYTNVEHFVKRIADLPLALLAGIIASLVSLAMIILSNHVSLDGLTNLLKAIPVVVCIPIHVGGKKTSTPRRGKQPPTS